MHMTVEPVKETVKWLTDNPQNIEGESSVSMAESYASFIRPEIVDATDPWISYVSIEYKERKRIKALESWKHNIADIEKRETGTLSFAILQDSGHPETVRTIEVFASQKYFEEVHILSKTKQDKDGNEERISLDRVSLKYLGGFLGR